MTEPVGTKKPSNFSCLANVSGVGIPGLEPGKTGPESVVLPLHHIPIGVFSFKRTVQSYELLRYIKRVSAIFFVLLLFSALERCNNCIFVALI